MVSTLLVTRKSWFGLVIAAINSAIICVIGVHTAQLGFVAANLFCIFTYAWSVHSWRRDRGLAREADERRSAAGLARYLPTAPAKSRVWIENPGLFLAYSASTYAQKQLQTVGELVPSGPGFDVRTGSWIDTGFPNVATQSRNVPMG